MTQNAYVDQTAFNDLVYPYNGTVSILQDEQTQIDTTTVVFNSPIVISMLIGAGLSLTSALFWLLRWMNDNSIEQSMEDAGMTKKLYDSKQNEKQKDQAATLQP